MPNQELIDYIKKEREQGLSDETIRTHLKDAGWKDEDVEEGFGGIDTKAPTPPLTTETQETGDDVAKRKRVSWWVKVVTFVVTLVVSVFAGLVFGEISSCGKQDVFPSPLLSPSYNSPSVDYVCYAGVGIKTLFFFVILYVVLFTLFKKFAYFLFKISNPQDILLTQRQKKIIKIIRYVATGIPLAFLLLAVGTSTFYLFDFLNSIIPLGFLYIIISSVLSLIIYPIIKIPWRYLGRHLLKMLYLLSCLFALWGLVAFWEALLNPPALKPVIYLYPQTTQDVTVQLDYHGTLIADYPTYNPTIGGWEVTAHPDGTLINHQDNQEYSYLFWEGKSATPIDWDLATGFVVKGEDTREFLQTKLAEIGLTPKEYNEFIVYWYPKMKDNPYNLIHFADSQYTDTAPLTITPKPDSLLRVFMVYKPLAQPIDITPQTFAPFERNGFTVVEWGGTEVR